MKKICSLVMACTLLLQASFVPQVSAEVAGHQSVAVAKQYIEQNIPKLAS